MKKKSPKPSRAFMVEAAKRSLRGMRKGEGGPFGAVIARGGKIIARGNNRVIAALDPTAHAEVVAIRAAARALKRFDLSGCDLYTSCEPCPMCLAAAYWAGIDRIFFSNSRRDAAAIGFGDALIYAELEKPADAKGRGRRKLPMLRLEVPEAAAAFKAWERMEDKTHYGPKP
jgi:guanine deaminase